MNNVLLTGASGFIGQNIIKNIEFHKDLKLHCHANKKITKNKKINVIKKQFNKFTSSDFKNIDIIIHSASVGVTNNNISLEECIDFNVSESLIFFQKALHAGCKNWIVLGSSSEYGNNLSKAKKIDVSETLKPADNYSLSKSLLYYSLMSIARIYNINLIYLRIFPVYGRYEKTHRLIPQMEKFIKLKKKFILKNPDALIDYSDVVDVSKKILNICKYMFYKKNLLETWHIASGENEFLKNFALRKWLELGGNRRDFKCKNLNKNIFHHISNKKSIWNKNNNL